MRHLIHFTLAITTLGAPTSSFVAAGSHPIVDTGQTQCYDNQRTITAPKPGQPFYGQDAQFRSHPASYTRSADGQTVHDNVTGLTWQRSPDTDRNGQIRANDKLTLAQARILPAQLNAAKFGGFDDWRLPSIKELYSLFDGRGTDPSGPDISNTARLTPFLDTNYFQFAYGDTSARERIIDSQYASSTVYVSSNNETLLFGVNFADGRIKGYGLGMPGGREKTFFVQCVRGNPTYGSNSFLDNRDGTITDQSTGLMWSQSDSGRGMNWQEALAWVQTKNTENYLGHDDWRLPSVKELESIVDYTRSPDATRSAALDAVFHCTTITNEAHQMDFPFFWSATTHAGLHGGNAAMYVAFGRAAGWMLPRGRSGPGSPPPGRPGGWGRSPGPDGPPPENQPGKATGEYRFVDIHGAGAQRSDPKDGDPSLFPHGRGPQGDVIRIYNHVRLVRGV